MLMQSDSANEARRLVVDRVDEGKRLDRYLSLYINDLSRQRLKGLILESKVSLGGMTQCDPAYKVKTGEVINVVVPEAATPELLGEDIALNIVFEDPNLIVIDKPPGLVTHPAPGNETGTLVAYQ